MKTTFKILLLLCLTPNCVWAYDFVVDGVYYNITDRRHRTVEVTHWEELTGEGGKPYRLRHHHNCGCQDDHCDAHEHQRLIQLDKDAVERERTAYIGRVVVPEKVRYKGIRYRVTGIGKGSFFGRKQLTEVVLPPTLTYIDDAAFEGCTAIRELNLPASVTTIGFAAFRRCMALKQVALPESVRTIDVYAFAFCENLTQLQMSASVDTFPGNIVFHCPLLKSIILPHTVPPVVQNDNGLKMNFRGITFVVPAAVLHLYRDDEFWSRQSVQALKQ